jgi:hypothetical protein
MQTQERLDRLRRDLAQTDMDIHNTCIVRPELKGVQVAVSRPVTAIDTPASHVRAIANSLA